jgi:hypothetical protein
VGNRSLFGVIAAAVGLALVWAGVTGRDPRADLIAVLHGRALAPSNTTGTTGSGTSTSTAAPHATTPLRAIMAALGAAVSGWHTIRTCGVDTLAGEATSEHVYCNAVDVGGSTAVLQTVWAWARRNGRALAIHCVIFNRQVASAPDFTVRPYSGVNPHTDHVHISALPSIGGAC